MADSLVTVEGEGGEELPNKNKIVKINWSEDNHPDLVVFVLPDTPEEAYYLFSAIITRKMLIEDFVINDISTVYRNTFEGGILSVEAEIPKLSTYLKKWERRRIAIAQGFPDDKEKSVTTGPPGFELRSYKEGKCTFNIKSIKELWTRFTMYNGYLTIKMHHGMEKTELGIPLLDYTNICSTKNWLYMTDKLLN